VDRRRFLLTSLAGAFAAPLPGIAQQASTIPVVGVLHDRPAGRSAMIEGLQAGLRRLGYVDGQTITFEVRFASGKREALASLARELVQRRVDVVFAVGPAALSAAKDASSTIPIVGVSLEIDPVAAGYARSVAQPGENVTGLFLDQPSIAGKWLQLIREVVTDIKRIAVLRDPTAGPWQLAAAKTIGQQLGMELQIFEAQYA